MPPQVNDTTYIYEHHTAPGATSASAEPTASNEEQHVILKRGGSNEPERIVVLTANEAEGGTNPTTATIYVAQSNEESVEVLRYSNPQVRYEESVYHGQYEYHHGAPPGSIPHSSAGGVPSHEEIKVEMSRSHAVAHHQHQQHQQQQHQQQHQQDIHTIYETDEGNRQETQVRTIICV